MKKTGYIIVHIVWSLIDTCKLKLFHFFQDCIPMEGRLSLFICTFPNGLTISNLTHLLLNLLTEIIKVGQLWPPLLCSLVFL